jgi:hypothetical protein
MELVFKNTVTKKKQTLDWHVWDCSVLKGGMPRVGIGRIIKAAGGL